MRAGEVCALAWSDVAPTVVTVRAGKTRAAARRVPLSPYARDLLAVLSSGQSALSGPDSASVFALSTRQIDALFRKAVRVAGSRICIGTMPARRRSRGWRGGWISWTWRG